MYQIEATSEECPCINCKCDPCECLSESDAPVPEEIDDVTEDFYDALGPARVSSDDVETEEVEIKLEADDSEIIPDEWLEHLVDQSENELVKTIKDVDRGEQGHYTLVLDSENEFWIVDEGVPVWRSSDSDFENIFQEWNSKMEDESNYLDFDSLLEKIEKLEDLPLYKYDSSETEAGGPGYEGMHYSDPMLWQAAVSMLDEAESSEDLDDLSEIING